MDYNFPIGFKPQHQSIQPGIESEMEPKPIYEINDYHKTSDRLKGKVALQKKEQRYV